MTRSLFSPLASSYLGFDSFFDEMDRLLDLAQNQTITSGYPPYDIYKQGKDYTLELAVAGFKEEDIRIEHDEQRHLLTITGDSSKARDGESPGRTAVKQSIAHRRFTRTFTVAESLIVESATLEDGLLVIQLKSNEAAVTPVKRIPLNAPPQLISNEVKAITNKLRQPEKVKTDQV